MIWKPSIECIRNASIITWFINSCRFLDYSSLQFPIKRRFTIDWRNFICTQKNDLHFDLYDNDFCSCNLFRLLTLSHVYWAWVLDWRFRKNLGFDRMIWVEIVSEVKKECLCFASNRKLIDPNLLQKSKSKECDLKIRYFIFRKRSLKATKKKSRKNSTFKWPSSEEKKLCLKKASVWNQSISNCIFKVFFFQIYSGKQSFVTTIFKIDDSTQEKKCCPNDIIPYSKKKNVEKTFKSHWVGGVYRWHSRESNTIFGHFNEADGGHLNVVVASEKKKNQPLRSLWRFKCLTINFFLSFRFIDYHIVCAGVF